MGAGDFPTQLIVPTAIRGKGTLHHPVGKNIVPASIPVWDDHCV